MATPVGPTPPDPDDPELWGEWYEDDADEGDYVPNGRLSTPVRLVALVVALAMALLVVLAR